MRLFIALRAFWKAFKDPANGQKFLTPSDCRPCQAQQQEKPSSSSAPDLSHLRLLAVLQQSARLVDFFKEDLTGCTDAQVGAAVRKIHEDCRKKLEEIVTIRPIYEQKEGSRISIAPGYDPATIKLVGKIKGEPPYEGTLVHQGWKAHKRSLPKVAGDQGSEILQPAEIEVR